MRLEDVPSETLDKNAVLTMNPHNSNSPQETLDPEDWEKTRALGRQMVDDMIEYIKTVRERPAWRTVPPESRAAISGETPRQGSALEDVYATFRDHILPYPTGNLHPGFMGWVMGNGTVTAMLADMLASGMNPHLAGYDQSASLVEKQVIAWLADLVEFPQDASGLLVSGGTMANINGLTAARIKKAGFDLREDGLQAPGAPRLRVYGGQETHSWIYKACELMGMGRSAFRAIAVNEAYQIDVDACRRQIEADIAAGDRPFCIIGTVGTVNTGAVDDIAGLRALADEFDLWLHIDGAFGSLAAWNDETKPIVAAQSSADSIAFDLHKWAYLPYDVGCVLTRDAAAQEQAFGTKASYLAPMQRGLAVDNTYFADRGVQLSRSFRALKVWMSLKEQGSEKIGRIIKRNVAQARYLAEIVEAAPDLEVLAPVALNIACFRFHRDGLDETRLNAVNMEILLRIQESGVAAPSQTILGGKFAIRACITNFRTRNDDLDHLVNETRRHGTEILAEMGVA